MSIVREAAAGPANRLRRRLGSDSGVRRNVTARAPVRKAAKPAAYAAAGSAPVVEREEGGEPEASESGEVVPANRRAEVGDREHREQGDGDDLLHGLELRRRVDGVADPVGRHGQAVFEEG